LKETAIYIHIPFCDHKCIYCDFYSIITSDNVENYLHTLKKEINYYADRFSEGRQIISVYFGGGTPSLMTPEYVHEIIETVKTKFILAENCEITLETNPGTVNKEKLTAFRNIDINRLSVGIQSFDKKDLEFMTRIHNPETAFDTVKNAKDAGFENINVDLIFNLPGQTKEKWKYNLDKAMQLPITHISPYSLILESGTILNKMVLDGKVTLQDDDYDADLYEYTINYLGKKGFQQYEVSNFCLPGYECVHNNAYWRYKDYLSFGTSAHSFMENKRWKNYSSLKFYLEAMNAKNNAVTFKEVLSEEEQLQEYTMLALRSGGLDKIELQKKFGLLWLELNRELFNLLLQNEYITETEELIKFTSKGYAVCDEILAKLK
jgi:oxygen-independent coproporphyrinogen III oxidase